MDRQGFPDLTGLGQRLAALALVGHKHDACVPIEIVERHRGHFTTPQPHPSALSISRSRRLSEEDRRRRGGRAVIKPDMVGVKVWRLRAKP